MAKKKPVKKSTPKKRIVSSAPVTEKPKAPAKPVVGSVAPASSSRQAPSQTQVVLPFTRKNYLLLLLGVAIIGVGFFLMSLDDFIDAREFSVSLHVAPIVVVAGFLEIIYAIMYRDKSEVATEA